MKRRFPLAVSVVWLCAGCAFDAAALLDLTSEASTAETSTIPDPVQAPPPIPAQPPITEPTAFDPAGLARFGFEDANLLTSLLADQLALDLLAPAGPALDYTYLQRLCLEGDDLDFVCHQRYGR